MPIPQFLKDFYYALFNAYFRKPVSKFILTFLYYYKPLLKMKIATHAYIEPNIEDIIYRHCVHSIIIGFYNLILVYSFLFCFINIYIYIVKYIYYGLYRINIGNSINNNEIYVCLLLHYEYNNILYTKY